MRAFAGVEPLVGEVVGLRTFRVDESGLLLPLYSDRSWYDGVNTATCAPPTGEAPRDQHAVPHRDCECGFYAYGTEAAARAHRGSRYVLAVVSCWGGVVAGTQGVRAEHARIDAIWLHPNIPSWTRHCVANRYPSARVYGDRSVMLAEHPPSVLPCYSPERERHPVRRLAAAAAAATVLTLGLLPAALVHGTPALRLAWLAAIVVLGAFTVFLLLGTHATGHVAAFWVAVGVCAWLLAPQFGLAGWLLRLPVLRAVLVVAGRFVLSLRPGYFPVEKGSRERAFCGVHA